MEVSFDLGNALAGLFTATGAIAAVWIAQRFFKKKMNTFESSLETSRDLLIQDIDSVRVELQFLKGEAETSAEGYKSLNGALAGIQEAVAKINASVSSQHIDEDFPDEGADENDSPRARLFEEWYEISDHLESIASSPAIDGRTRAKYGRIDRRSYYDLVDKLDEDHLLDGEGDTVHAAVELWYSNRRRKDISAEDAQRMADLSQAIRRLPILNGDNEADL